MENIRYTTLLEKEICAYFNTEKSLLLPSGYMGMSILIQSEGTSRDHLFIDSDAHYSVWDAVTSSHKPVTPFHHLNPESLQRKITEELLPDEIPVVISDAVFPVSGEIAPLPEYLKVLQPYDGRIYLDDAHGMGVLGEHGRGILDYFGIDARQLQSVRHAQQSPGWLRWNYLPANPHG